MKGIMFKAASALSVLAMTLAVGSISNLCFFFYHQPDVPESLKSHEG